eukprot:GHVT01082924.1.p2 GENE.GHVT01082924.1~~GHVT01082924.1.p2  ORF type:complete len:103 (-),score=17.52 GHVT01082924.1:358-666(-)
MRPSAAGCAVGPTPGSARAGPSHSKPPPYLAPLNLSPAALPGGVAFGPPQQGRRSLTAPRRRLADREAPANTPNRGVYVGKGKPFGKYFQTLSDGQRRHAKP